MKIVLLLLVLAGGIFIYLYATGSAVKKGFDPNEQGRQARAAIKEGAHGRIVDMTDEAEGERVEIYVE